MDKGEWVNVFVSNSDSEGFISVKSQNEEGIFLHVENTATFDLNNSVRLFLTVKEASLLRKELAKFLKK